MLPEIKWGIDQAWLMGSKLPFPLSFIAIHTWFVVSDRQNLTHRWEIWHRQLPAEKRFGHIHYNLFPPFLGIAINPLTRSRTWASKVYNYWEGDIPLELLRLLAESAQSYPVRNKYHYWPGPNSNTYIQWILRRLSQPVENLPWKAVGAKYRIKFSAP